MSPRRPMRTFFSGLAVVLPVAVTIWLLLWLFRTAEATLEPVLGWLAPEGGWFPGAGLILALALIFGVGVLMEAVYFRRLWRWFEELLNRIPLVKTIYSAVRDLMSLFSQTDGKKKFSKVVMVKLQGIDAQLIGFVTIEDFAELPFKPAAGTVAVYLPMSYQIGGYTLFLPRAALTPVDMSLEEAMRFVVTAGMSR